MLVTGSDLTCACYNRDIVFMGINEPRKAGPERLQKYSLLRIRHFPISMTGCFIKKAMHGRYSRFTHQTQRGLIEITLRFQARVVQTARN